jgi:hypothetical protein
MKVVSTEKDMRVASMKGHAIILKANEPKEIREDLGLIALEQGAKLVSDKPKEVIEEVTEVADEEPEIVIESAESEDDGFEELVAVMKGLIDEGDPDNFKTDGTPKAAVVNKLSGSTITTEQREAAWEEALNAG